MAVKIKQGDEVIVIAGRDKGKKGSVLRLVDVKAYVEGINIIKKHVKPDPRNDQPGGIVEREAPIHLSNLALIDSSNGKPTRVGFKILEDGKKVRYLKGSGEQVDA